MPHVAIYITGHGFGHATRMAALASALAEQAPGLRLSIVSTVPDWLFRLNRSAPVSLRARALDVGAVQVDAIRLDEAATLAAYAAIEARKAPLVVEEATWLRAEGVDLVVADIPPAAFPAARRAGLPSVGISNFSWDWIYAEYVRRFPTYAGLIPAIRSDYGAADLFLRLPFHGPCDAFPVVRDIPMIARRARRSRKEVRRSLGLNGGRPVVLLSFGGFDLHGLDFTRIAELDEFLFLTTQPPPRPLDNVRVVPVGQLPYEELVAQADIVLTKPGYGIVSDCLANGTRLLYTARGEFAEYACLTEGLAQFGVAAEIGVQDLLNGNWARSLRALLERPAPEPHLPVNGAEVAAEIVLDWVARSERTARP